MSLDIIIQAWLIWFLLGVGLALLELFLPGFILLFFAIGCWAAAGALLIHELSLTQQILVFIVTSIVSLVLLRQWMMQTFQGTSSETVEGDYDDFPLGLRVPVIKTISPDSSGRIQYRGTAWDAVAEETIEEGATVEIVGYAGKSRLTFLVRKTYQP